MVNTALGALVVGCIYLVAYTMLGATDPVFSDDFIFEVVISVINNLGPMPGDSPGTPVLYWQVGALIYTLVGIIIGGITGALTSTPSVRPRRIFMSETLNWSWSSALRTALVGILLFMLGGGIVILGALLVANYIFSGIADVGQLAVQIMAASALIGGLICGGLGGVVA